MNRFSRDSFGQSSDINLQGSYNSFLNNCKELKGYLESHYSTYIKTLPMGLDHVAKTSTDSITVYLKGIEIKVSYIFIHYPGGNPYDTLIINALEGPEDEHGPLDYHKRLNGEEPLEITKQVIEKFLNDKGEVPKDLSSMLLDQIEKVDKASPSDEKLNLWQDIQKINDPAHKQMLEQKFKSKVANRFDKILWS